MAARPLLHPRLQRALGLGELSPLDHPHPGGLESPCSGPRPGPCLLGLPLLLLPQPHCCPCPAAVLPWQPEGWRRATVVAAGGDGGHHLLAAPAWLFPSPREGRSPWSPVSLPKATCHTTTTLLLPLQRDCRCLHGAKPRGGPGTGQPEGALGESAHVPARQWTRLPASRGPNTSPIAEQTLPSVSLPSQP